MADGGMPAGARRAASRRRTSVSAEVFTSMAQQASLGAAGGPAAEPPRARTRDMSPAMRERALGEMSKNLLFSSIREAERMRIVDSLFDVEVQAGEDVMQQGADGDNFYIIDHGVLEVFKQDVAAPVHAYDNAGSFGELALMYSQPRAATVRAASECLLWAMSRQTYQHMMRESEQAKRDEIQGFLQQVPLFAGLKDEAGSHQLANLTDMCVSDENQRTFESGEYIMHQGEEGDEFFILQSGTAEATVAGVGVVRQYGAGDYFGEKALMNDSGLRAASIVATSTTRCLVVPAKDFKNLLGSLRDEFAQSQQQYEQAIRNSSGDRSELDDRYATEQQQPPQQQQQQQQQQPQTQTQTQIQIQQQVATNGTYSGVDSHTAYHDGQQFSVPAAAPPTSAPRPAAAPAAASFTITDEDAAIAEIYETGVVFKMVGARGSHQGAADDAAFLFQLAPLRSQLVLRWSDIQTRQPVGYVPLAKIAQLEFDPQRLLAKLSSGRHAPIFLVASRETDFQTFCRALQHLHSEHRDQEIAALESELQADETAQMTLGSSTHEYIGGNRVNRWGELTGDDCMPTRRPTAEPTAAPVAAPAAEPVAEPAAKTAARDNAEGRAVAEAEAAATKTRAEAEAARAHAEAEAAKIRARAEAEAEAAIARARAEAEAEAVVLRAKAEAEAAAVRARAESDAAEAAAKSRADAAAAVARTEASAAAQAQAEAAQARASAHVARQQAAQADAARIEASRSEAAMAKSAQIEAARVEVARAEAAQMRAQFARAQEEAAEIRAQMDAQRVALEHQKAELEAQRIAIAQEERAAMERARAASDAHAREQLKRHESEVARQREALRAEKAKVAAELRAAQEASRRQAELQPEPEPEPEPLDPTADRIPEAVQMALIQVIADAISQGRTIFGVTCRDVGKFFSIVDRDHNGWLSRQELQAAMSRLDMGLVDEQLRRLVHTIDADHDGRIELNEFERWLSKPDLQAAELQAQQDQARLQWQAERRLETQSVSSREEPHSAPTSAPSSVQDDEQWSGDGLDDSGTTGVVRRDSSLSEAVPHAHRNQLMDREEQYTTSHDVMVLSEAVPAPQSVEGTAAGYHTAAALGKRVRRNQAGP